MKHGYKNSGNKKGFGRKSATIGSERQHSSSEHRGADAGGGKHAFGDFQSPSGQKRGPGSNRPG